MEAVYSAVGPEVQNDQRAAQRGESHAPGINPLEVCGELRSAHDPGVLAHLVFQRPTLGQGYDYRLLADGSHLEQLFDLHYPIEPLAADALPVTLHQSPMNVGVKSRQFHSESGTCLLGGQVMFFADRDHPLHLASILWSPPPRFQQHKSLSIFIK